MYNVWRTTVILIVTMYTEFVLYYTMLIVLNKFNSIQFNYRDKELDGIDCSLEQLVADQTVCGPFAMAGSCGQVHICVRSSE